MKAKKIIIKDIDIQIREITVLSAEEAELVPAGLLSIEKWYWLRSPGRYSQHSQYAMTVSYDGYINRDGSLVDTLYAVRPALRIGNLEECGLSEGDRIEVMDKQWTIIPGGMALCNKSIGERPFRRYNYMGRDNFYTPDGGRHLITELNDYEFSDLKAYVNEWARRNG